MNIQELSNQAKSLWSLDMEPYLDIQSVSVEIHCNKEQIPHICNWLFNQQNYHFVGLIVEENALWELCYLFAGEGEMGCVKVMTGAPLNESNFKSVGMLVHAADWYEREAEDLFGLHFEDHPRLGDFILHDDVWQEGVEPMRKSFDSKLALSNRKPNKHWHPRRILEESGTFIMPIGPVFSGTAESVHFQLETIGEEIVRAFPRLFFKYRGVEKIAEGRFIDDALLLAERNAGTTAFSHALAYCMAIEQLREGSVPKRAQVLRVFFAELERVRNHIGTIESICNSTGLAVAANQVAILEEEMLRLTGSLVEHRYLFGLVIPGGLSRDCDEVLCLKAVNKIKKIVYKLNEIEKFLINTSSFLDRLEEVGIISKAEARNYELVGPIARASNYCTDLRKFQPYLKYDTFKFEVPCETEGDGYARLRILFAEVEESVRIMEQAVKVLPEGPVFSEGKVRAGVAFAGVETPRGAAWHWVHVDEEGKLKRYRLLIPSFANWHAFHLAVENFTFQDLPIILATLGLSVAENDR